MNQTWWQSPGWITAIIAVLGLFGTVIGLVWASIRRYFSEQQRITKLENADIEIKNSIDVLTRKVDKLIPREGELVQLRKDLDEHVTSCPALEFAGRLSALEAGQTHHTTHLAEVRNHLCDDNEKMEKKIDTLGEKLDTLQGSLLNYFAGQKLRDEKKQRRDGD